MSWTEPILHVDMDAFFVEVERLRNPALAGRPVVVGGGGLRGVVASASYEARGWGIRSAMPTSQAKRRCPDLVVVPPDHAAYRRMSERVFAILRSFTPLVEGLSLDEAFLDVGGLRRHYASPLEVANQIRARIRRELGLPASVGVAANKLCAKLASQEAKPDGVYRVAADDQLRFLSPLPIERLWGVGTATKAVLWRLGVETIGDLAAVGRATLVRELGSTLASHLLDLASGRDDRGVVPDGATKSISSEQTFPTDVGALEELIAALRRHADRVGSRARRAGVRARTVSLKLRFFDFRTLNRSRTLPRATDTDVEIYRVARELFRTSWDGTPLRLVGVSLSGLEPNGLPRQLGLGSDTRWERVDAAVDAVRRRFGEEVVVPARLMVDPPGTQGSGDTYTEPAEPA